MRVVFQHTDPEHPNAGVAAYKLGRAQGFTNHLTGDSHSADDLVVALLDQARAEYPEPEYAVWPERLVATVGELGEEGSEAEWRPIDEDALRARASGEPVDVPEVDRVAGKKVKVSAKQSQAATEGA